ncbi:MAG: LTA synthase family protein [Eubacteriales bacterium]|nr:LTA synthase family protein [Eubacteriales bacterium]
MTSLIATLTHPLVNYLLASSFLILVIIQAVALDRPRSVLGWLFHQWRVIVPSLLLLSLAQLLLIALVNHYWLGFSVVLFLTYVIASVDHVKFENALTHFLWSDLFKSSDPGKFSELVSHYIRPILFVPISSFLVVGNIFIARFVDRPFASGLAGMESRVFALVGSLAILVLFSRYSSWANGTMNRRFKLVPSFNSQNYDQNVRLHGVLLGFVGHIRLVAVEQDRPLDYRADHASSICDVLNQTGGHFFVNTPDSSLHAPICETPQASSPITEPPVLPTLIIFALEAFWDITRIPGLTFTEDPFAAFRQDFQGDVRASCFAGSTANTEFEFLTSLSMQNLHDAACPFLHLQQDVPALPAYLKTLGYQTTAFHSYTRTFYDRDRIYPAFGFDHFLGLEEFLAAGQYREKGWYMADEALIDPICQQLDATSEPQMLYVLTMQNHGPYATFRYAQDEIDPQSTPIFDAHLAATSGDQQAIINYTQGVRDAGKLYQAVKTHLQASEKPAIILTFGDHLPGLGEHSGYQLMLKSGFAKSVQDPALYAVPWCLWANPQALQMGLTLTAESGEHACDFNALAPQLLHAAKLPLQAHHRLVMELQRQKNSPAGVSAELLYAYEWLQYDWLWGEHTIQI